MRFTPGTSDIEQEAAALDGVIVTEERGQIAAMVGDLQRASTPSEFYALHDLLLRRSYARQKVAAELRESIGKQKHELGQLVRTKPLPRDKVVAAQQTLTNLELAERSCKAVAHALRCVGDGIAWKTLGYDRGAITVLGAGKRVGRLAAGKGLDAELQAIAAYWEDGEFAIHNDLTNCLRTGDLTLPFRPAGAVEVREVKAATRSSRRQREAAEARIAFLRDGQGSSVFGDASAQLARYPLRFQTALPRLRDLLARAREDGYASARLASSVVVTTCDPRVSQGDPGIDVAAEQARAAAGWYDDPRTVTTFTLIRRIRERMHHFPFLAPLTIYPLPADDVAELLLGPLEYVTSLHAPSLEREFRFRGVEAQVLTRPPESARVFLRAVRGSAQVQLPALVCEQLLTELLSPECLVAAVLYMLDRIDAGDSLGNTLTCLADEAETWAGYAPVRAPVARQ